MKMGGNEELRPGDIVCCKCGDFPALFTQDGINFYCYKCGEDFINEIYN